MDSFTVEGERAVTLQSEMAQKPNVSVPHFQAVATRYIIKIQGASLESTSNIVQESRIL